MKNLKTFDALFESAKDFINIPATAGFVLYADDNYSKGIYLFDFKERKCIGMIVLAKTTNRRTKETLWSVITVAAEPGFGPMMYKCAMMAVHPESVCPYRGTIRPDAIKVWQIFSEKPEELTQKRIDPDDSTYYDFGDDDMNWVLNTTYSRPSNFWFKKKLAIGEDFMDKYNIDAKAVDTACKEYFNSRYDK